MIVNGYDLHQLLTYKITEPDVNQQQNLVIKLRKSGNNDIWINLITCPLPSGFDNNHADVESEVVTQEIVKIIEQVSGISVPRSYLWDNRRALAYLTDLISRFASNPNIDPDTYAHFINICQTTYRGRIWSINDEDSFKEFLSIFGWTQEQIDEELIKFVRTLPQQ